MGKGAPGSIRNKKDYCPKQVGNKYQYFFQNGANDLSDQKPLKIALYYLIEMSDYSSIKWDIIYVTGLF